MSLAEEVTFRVDFSTIDQHEVAEAAQRQIVDRIALDFSDNTAVEPAILWS